MKLQKEQSQIDFRKRDKIYIPKTEYYHGNTLKLIEEISKSKLLKKKFY